MSGFLTRGVHVHVCLCVVTTASATCIGVHACTTGRVVLDAERKSIAPPKWNPPTPTPTCTWANTHNTTKLEDVRRH